MALFIGLGPLFILCLLFDQTKQLFQRWLFYGIGTMFSMAVLAAMVSIALDMVIRVSASFWMTALVNKFPLMGASSDGMTSQAMQQGGIGLILTTLILTAPPMAAMFFQGTLGSFMAYSQIGGSPVAQAPGPSGSRRVATMRRPRQRIIPVLHRSVPAMARLLVTVSGAQVRSSKILESMGRLAPERGLTVSNDKGVRMKCIVVLLLLVISNVALAEGRCPRAVPVGGQGVGGCAPIPGGQAGGESSGPMPTGKWETRWGALAQDTDHQVGQNLAIGVAEVKTKRS